MASHNLTPKQFRALRELVAAHRAGDTGEFALIDVMSRPATVEIEGSEREVPASKFDLLALERAGFVILEDRNGVLFGQLQQQAFDAVDEGVEPVTTGEDRFSRRYGYLPGDAEITIREDAPESLRAKVIAEARTAGVSGSKLYQMIAGFMGKQQYMSDWSDVWYETQQLIDAAHWPVVYDLAEAITVHLRQIDPVKADRLEAALNAHFREAGIGWQLIDGKIQTRGPEAFEVTVRGAETKLTEAGLPTASQEIREALLDLSKRPEPDLTGAIHHGVGALECVAREACGNINLTLGGIAKQHPQLFPGTLLTAVEKVWGYASETGRHIREGGKPDRTDVEFVVGLAATVATYLAAKLKQPGGGTA